jgi:excisionase family DNA binding protein
VNTTLKHRRPRALTIVEVAERLGVSTRSVKRYIARGYLTAWRLPSPSGRGHLRIDEPELARFMVENGWVK